jgi:RNA polymerase-binding transcription factor DksA
VKRSRRSSPRFPGDWFRKQERKLAGERDRLRAEVERETSRLGVTGTDDPREAGDIAEEAREDDESSRTLAVLESRLRAVEEALDRIAAGSYGCCSGCDAPISRERLEAFPAAVRCVACQHACEGENGG